MPIYMRFEPLGSEGTGDSGFPGGVTADGYQDWIAIESIEFGISCGESETAPAASGGSGAGAAGAGGAAATDDRPAPGATSPELVNHVVHGPTAGAMSVEAAQAASLAGGQVQDADTTDASIGDITVSKRLDKASAALFGWAGQDTSDEDTEMEPRVIEAHKIAMAADGLNFMESVLQFRLEGCTPKSMTVNMNDPEGGPSETLVFNATAVTMYFLASDADGTVDDYYEEATFTADDLSENEGG